MFFKNCDKKRIFLDLFVNKPDGLQGFISYHYVKAQWRGPMQDFRLVVMPLITSEICFPISKPISISPPMSMCVRKQKIRQKYFRLDLYGSCYILFPSGQKSQTSFFFWIDKLDDAWGSKWDWTDSFFYIPLHTSRSFAGKILTGKPVRYLHFVQFDSWKNKLKIECCITLILFLISPTCSIVEGDQNKVNVNANSKMTAVMIQFQIRYLMKHQRWLAKQCHTLLSNSPDFPTNHNTYLHFW